MKYGYIQKRKHKNPKLCSMFPIPDEDKFPITKRMFELAMKGHSAAVLSSLLKQEFPDHRSSINKTVIDKRLRDSFYCGLWVIRKGTKQERIVDLNQITLNDGTCFQPALTIKEFGDLQDIRATNRNGAMVKRRRINPLPKLVTC